MNEDNAEEERIAGARERLDGAVRKGRHQVFPVAKYPGERRAVVKMEPAFWIESDVPILFGDPGAQFLVIDTRQTDWSGHVVLFRM